MAIHPSPQERTMSPRLRTSSVALLLLSTSIVSACRSESGGRSADTARSSASGDAAMTADSTHAGGAMGGMKGMHEDTLAPKVQAHLQRLQTSNPDSLRALVSEDRQVVTTLIADCEQMMRGMKMDPPRKWRNAVQELRQDLDRMANMTTAQLQQAMPEHRKRIEGMLAMRRDMMRM